MASLYYEIQYINQISFRLNGFKQNSQRQWTMRCPYCGDSESKPKKTSGYIYDGGNNLFYICYKCHVTADFPRFLKKIDPELYRQFLRDKFKDTKKEPEEGDISCLDDLTFKIMPFMTKKRDETRQKSLDLISTDTLDKDHPAIEYLKSRNIPKDKWSRIYYTSKLESVCKQIQGKAEPRIVLCCNSVNGKPFAVIGRILPGYSGIRYKIYRLNNEYPLVYGLEYVNFKERIYVLEGSLDSLFLPNSLAVCSSHLHAINSILQQHEVKEIPPITLVFDNEKRSPVIVSLMLKAIGMNYDVCVWPSNLKGKDVNDVVVSNGNILDIINDNTYRGMEAKMKVRTWKRCDIDGFSNFKR